MITIPDAMRRPAEVEREELQKQLSEARAEIERLRARNAMLDNAIAEMTEEQAALCAEGQTITELVAAKNKLIEQMRTALQAVQRDDLNGLSLRDKDKVDAALSAANRFAAERGEG